MKHNDWAMNEVQEDEVLFEKNDEDPVMIVETTSSTLTQATAHSVTILNEKLLQA